MKGFFKKRLGSLIAAVLLSISMFLTLAMVSASAEPQQTESPAGYSGTEVGFFVRAQIPKNQIDFSLTYFDLLMQPKAWQTIAVEIVNEEGQDIVVDVSVISASTNENGLIDYLTPAIRDETLLYPLSELAQVSQPEIMVPANGSAVAYVDIEMPKEEFDGVVLGGIVIRRQEDEDQPVSEMEQDGQTGSIILNRYSYVVGVKLTETDTIVQPNFTLISVAPKAVNYTAAIVHYLRNSESFIVKNMDVKLIIKDEGNSKVLEDDWTIDMAPNSVIELPAYPEDGELNAGTYTSYMVLTLEGKVFELDYTFTIDKKEIKEVYDSVITEKPHIPSWVWVIIILQILVTAAIVLLLVILYKRRKKR